MTFLSSYFVNNGGSKLQAFYFHILHCFQIRNMQVTHRSSVITVILFMTTEFYKTETKNPKIEKNRHTVGKMLNSSLVLGV